MLGAVEMEPDDWTEVITVLLMTDVMDVAKGGRVSSG